MNPPRGATSDELNRIRIALNTAIAHSSLRAVAAEVGMSPTGLGKFLDGGQPYAKTVERVRRWYHKHDPAPGVLPDLVTDMVADLPPSERPAALAELLHAAAEIYRTRGAALPRWLAGQSETPT